MQKPTPQDYGLKYGDVAACERWERWLNRLPWIGSISGGVCGFLIGGPASDIIGNDWRILFVWGGAIVGPSIADNTIVKGAISKLNPRLSRVRQFRSALFVFESARKEAEERELRGRSQFWLTQPGHAFERELATILERAGYEVTRTPGSGDGGIDLVLRHSGRTIVVQCKQTKTPVGPGAARDLYGALLHCGADEGILATTAGVTSGVHKFFKGKPLRVMALTEILALHESTRSQ